MLLIPLTFLLNPSLVFDLVLRLDLVLGFVLNLDPDFVGLEPSRSNDSHTIQNTALWATQNPQALQGQPTRTYRQAR